MKKNVALVLSGGGARGIAHIGVIEELLNQGFNISSISGTSMGAFVGGIYALNKMDDFKNWLYDLEIIDVLKLLDFSVFQHGLIKGDRLFHTLKKFIPDKQIKDLEISYAAVATDIISKKEFVFTEGDLFQAIRASISIPTIFTPVKFQDTILVDGGVVNNVPINHVKRSTDDLLVVSYVNADVPPKKLHEFQEKKAKKRKIYLKKLQLFNHLLQEKSYKKNNDLSYFKIINTSFGMLMNRASIYQMEKYTIDILINISRESAGIFDFLKAEELVEVGRMTTREMLQNSNYKNEI